MRGPVPYHPSQQLQAMPGRRVAPTNPFVEFRKEDIEQSIPARFEQQVCRYPQRLAVMSHHTGLSYRALDQMANRVAQAILARHGAGPAQVALLLEHDTPAIAAMLGVLKAGKICVPLDSQAPEERLRDLLSDAQATLLVADEMHHAVTRALGLSGCAVSSLEELVACGADGAPGVPLAPDQLAYLLYTSGSTGRPKGVAKSHRSVLDEIRRLTNAFHLSADDRHTLLRSVSSNGAMQDIYDGLLNGGAVCLFPLMREGVEALASWLRRHEITVYRSAASVFRAFVRTLADPAPFPRLRLIQSGGEPALAQDVALYQRYFSPDCLFVNSFAMTETGPVCMYFMDKASPLPDAAVPVGYPVEGTEILLRDETGHEVVTGETGEIVVKSRYLSAGYWRQPALTRAAFLPDPAGGSKPDRQLYLTGDLGLMLPDGCLIHKGRRDFRVKIRGYGVEIGEVEKALLEHEAIREAVVVARQNESGEHRLVAYFSPDPHTVPSVTAVRSFLKDKLPGYMIPSAFVALDALPLTPQGKVDRNLLPDPGTSRQRLDRELVAARTTVEDQLARMWEEVLDVRPIGIHDDFFEMGGHSLLAVRLLAQIEKTFGQRLPPATLFEAPTVEKLAAIVSRQGRTAFWSSLVAVQSGGSKPPFFWVHGEKSNAFLPRHLGPDQPLYGLLHQSHGGKRARYTRIEDIAAHYVQEVRGVQPNGPYFLGGFCVGGTLAFEMAQQLHRQGQEIALLLLLDPSTPHDGGGSRPQSSCSSPLLPKRTRDAVARHVRNLALRGPQEKAAYVLEGAKWRLKRRMAKLTEIAERVACQAYLVTRMSPIPLSLRIPYIDLVHRRAGRRYVPHVYPGRIVVLKTEGSPPDPQSVWGRLAGGGLEVVEVAGTHTEIVFSEPQIQGLAKHVKAWLDRTQANGR